MKLVQLKVILQPSLHVREHTCVTLLSFDLFDYLFQLRQHPFLPSLPSQATSSHPSIHTLPPNFFNWPNLNYLLNISCIRQWNVSDLKIICRSFSRAASPLKRQVSKRHPSGRNCTKHCKCIYKYKYSKYKASQMLEIWQNHVLHIWPQVFLQKCLSLKFCCYLFIQDWSKWVSVVNLSMSNWI